MNRMLFYIKMHLRLIKSYFTNVMEMDLYAYWYGQYEADYFSACIENKIRTWRSQGITKLSCGKCGDIELPNLT